MLLDPLECDIRDVGLAECHPVQEKRGITAENESVEVCPVVRHNILGLEPSEILDVFRRRQGTAELLFPEPNRRILIDFGGDAHGFDARSPQNRTSGRRCRCKDEAHADTVPRNPCENGRMTVTSDLRVGEDIELDITGIAHGGITVARYEGRVVFVSDAIPGERVIARVTDAKTKRFARATATRVLRPSPDRRAHVWSEASIDRDPEDRVGGAEFGHIALERQRALKREVLTDAMQRFGGVTVDVPVAACPGDAERNGLGYRSRVRLHVDAASGVVGPYAQRSRRVVEVTSLPLANVEVNVVAPLGEVLPDVRAVHVIAPSGSDPRTLFTPADRGERVGENDRVLEVVGERNFIVRAGGFWQVHREAPKLLLETVRDAVASLGSRFEPTAPNLDLYGGVGLLAAGMIEGGGPRTRVTSVEVDPGATDDAAENLADTVGALAVTAKVDTYLRDLAKNANQPARDRMRRATVVLDPPRTGAGIGVTETLAGLEPANIIYVACDPVALARDTKVLQEAGYELTQLRAFDLFPHTHHFETVAVFERSAT